jgi:DNA-binding XRE family transcriptional regulator
MLGFAERLTELRSLYHLTQGQMAKRLGISPQYLCDLEHGRRKPSLTVVNALCNCFGPNGPSDSGFRRSWHRTAAKEHGWRI